MYRSYCEHGHIEAHSVWVSASEDKWCLGGEEAVLDGAIRLIGGEVVTVERILASLDEAGVSW